MRLPWPFRRETKQTDAEILAMLGGSVATASGMAVSHDTALRVPAVAAAVRTISEACASLSCFVVEIADDGSENIDRAHPANALIAGEANDWTSSFEMIRTLVADALCRDQGGLAWVNWVNGKPIEIIRYRPGIIAAEYDPQGTGEPHYRINGRPVPRQQIVHLRSTFDKSPVSLCREAIGVAMVMEQHAAALFGNGGRPSVVLQTPKPIGEAGAVNMLKGWKTSFSDGSKSGGVGIVYDGTTVQQLTLSSVDAQFQELRVFQLQEMARAFNIPSVLIGELSRATWSNSAEMQRLFLMLCLEPWLLALESAFRRALFLKEDRARYAVRFERDDFSKVDLQVLATAINSLVASRVLSPNEARDWLGMPKGPAELDKFANPNTGASQPGQPTPAGNQAPPPQEEDDDDGSQ